jgi:hypothetical protein
MPKVFDTDIVETSSTVGPGTYTLNGPRIGYRSFDEGFNSGDTPYYVVRNAADNKWEHNRGGVFTAGVNTLTRNVIRSSNGGAPVSWDISDHPLLVYVPSATEIYDEIIRGFRGGTRSAWLQAGALWTRSDFPAIGQDTVMFFDGSVDVPVIQEEGGSAYHLSKPPGEYVDVAYVVNPGAEPAGTLICDGGAVSRTTYSKLFSKVSTGHGAGNGTTTFNKPDCRGRNKISRDNQGGTVANVIDAAYYGGPSVHVNGAKGGTKGHVSGVGVSVSVSVSVGIGGGTFGSIGLIGNTPGPDSTLSRGDQGGGTNVASQSHTHSLTSGATSGALGVSGSGSGSGSGGGATGAFTVIQPGIIVDTLITTGGQ